VKQPSRLQLGLILGLSVLLVVLVVASLVQDKPSTAAPANTETVTFTQENPAENPVTNYTVPAKQPLSITIANADIEGYIQKVGVDQNKDITAPNNVNLAGWFTDSVLPGGLGLSIIDGHVDGRTQRGIFHNLKQVKVGDEVIITYGDKSTKTFTVFATHSLASDDSASSLFNQDPKVVSQLNIITCTGKYDTASKEYRQRLIVSAKLDS